MTSTVKCFDWPKEADAMFGFTSPPFITPLIFVYPFYHSRSADFDFARYAVKVTNRQILSMANFSLSNWLVLILLHWLFCGLGQVAPPKKK